MPSKDRGRNKQHSQKAHLNYWRVGPRRAKHEHERPHDGVHLVILHAWKAAQCVETL